MTNARLNKESRNGNITTFFLSKKLFDKIQLICYNNTRKGLIL